MNRSIPHPSNIPATIILLAPITDVASGAVSSTAAWSMPLASISNGAFWGALSNNREGLHQYVYGFAFQYGGKYIITLETVDPTTTPLPTATFIIGTQN